MIHNTDINTIYLVIELLIYRTLEAHIPDDYVLILLHPQQKILFKFKSLDF